jgi:23S rRNA (adenine2503-C2)-methyltransferase
MPDSEKTNLLNLNRLGLESYFIGIGEKSFRAKQFMQWVHQRGVTDFEKMTDMSKSLREKLQHEACIILKSFKNRKTVLVNGY